MCAESAQKVLLETRAAEILGQRSQLLKSRILFWTTVEDCQFSHIHMNHVLKDIY